MAFEFVQPSARGRRDDRGRPLLCRGTAALLALMALVTWPAAPVRAARPDDGARSLPGRAEAGVNNLLTATTRKVATLLGRGRDEEAVSLVSSAIKKARTDHEAYQLRAVRINLGLRILQDRGDGRQALVRRMKGLMDRTGGMDRERAYLLCARVHSRIGNYRQAGKLLNEYLADYPEPSPEELRKFREAAREVRGRAASGMSHPRLIYRYLADQMLRKIDLIGRRVPAFEFTTLRGEKVTPKSFEGRVWVMDFWAAGCSPYVDDLPRLKETYDRYHGQGLEVLGVNLDGSGAVVRAFQNEHRVPWQQVHPGEKRYRVAGRFYVEMVPSSCLVDRSGVVRAIDLRGMVLRREVKKLLAEENVSSGD